MKSTATIIAEALSEIGNKVNISSISPMDVAQRIIDLATIMLRKGEDAGHLDVEYNTATDVITIKPAAASDDTDIDIRLRCKGNGYIILENLYFPQNIGVPGQALRLHYVFTNPGPPPESIGILEWFTPAYLDENYKIPIALLPAEVLGERAYQGAWDCELNYPALPEPSEDNIAWFYWATTSGDLPLFGSDSGDPAPSGSGSDTYQVNAGDFVISNGTEWEVIPNNNNVVSVFGRKGAVEAQYGDYSWQQIDKSISDITDIVNRSHTNLQDIGTHTHAEIDDFINNHGDDGSESGGGGSDYALYLLPNGASIKGYTDDGIRPMAANYEITLNDESVREWNVGGNNELYDIIYYLPENSSVESGWDVIIYNTVTEAGVYPNGRSNVIIKSSGGEVIFATLRPGESIRCIYDNAMDLFWRFESLNCGIGHTENRVTNFINANYLLSTL